MRPSLLAVVASLSVPTLAAAEDRVIYNKDGSVTVIKFDRRQNGTYKSFDAPTHYQSKADYTQNRPLPPSQVAVQLVMQLVADYLSSEDGQRFLASVGATAAEALSGISTTADSAWKTGGTWSRELRQYFGGTMSSGETLRPGGGARSTNGRYTLTFQHDGNLVLRDGQRAIWSSQTDGTADAVCCMQADGNLVIYGRRGGARSAVWESRTSGHPGANLHCQTDGNLVVYRRSTALWSSGTTGK